MAPPIQQDVIDNDEYRSSSGGADPIITTSQRSAEKALEKPMRHLISERQKELILDGLSSEARPSDAHEKFSINTPAILHGIDSLPQSLQDSQESFTIAAKNTSRYADESAMIKVNTFRESASTVQANNSLMARPTRLELKMHSIVHSGEIREELKCPEPHPTDSALLKNNMHQRNTLFDTGRHAQKGEVPSYSFADGLDQNRYSSNNRVDQEPARRSLNSERAGWQ